MQHRAELAAQRYWLGALKQSHVNRVVILDRAEGCADRAIVLPVRELAHEFLRGFTPHDADLACYPTL